MLGESRTYANGNGAARMRAVVQNVDATLPERVEPTPQNDLATRTGLPRPGALRVIGQREHQAAEFGMRLPDPRLPPRLASLVLPQGGRPGDS